MSNLGISITLDPRESGLMGRALTMLIRSNLAISEKLRETGGDPSPIELENDALRALHRKATGGREVAA